MVIPLDSLNCIQKLEEHFVIKKTFSVTAEKRSKVSIFFLKAASKNWKWEILKL